MVMHVFNPSTLEEEAGGCLWVWGQPCLQELVPGQAPKLQKNPLSKKQTNNNNKQNNEIATLEFKAIMMVLKNTDKFDPIIHAKDVHDLL